MPVLLTAKMAVLPTAKVPIAKSFSSVAKDEAAGLVADYRLDSIQTEHGARAVFIGF